MDDRTRQTLLSIYAATKTIAVVGASSDPEKPAHEIPRYLGSQGYRIIPITPRTGTLFGERTRASLAELTEPPDVVEVFRPPDEARAVAEAAIAAGARVLWFQPGTETDDAVRLARDAGLMVVSGMCMGTMHGQLGLGPGPWR